MEKWIEEFDLVWFGNMRSPEDYKKHVKSFISKTRAEAYEEGVKFMMNNKDDLKIVRSAKQEVLALIEERFAKKKDNWQEYDMKSNCDSNYINGYDECRAEVLSLLQELKKDI